MPRIEEHVKLPRKDEASKIWMGKLKGKQPSFLKEYIAKGEKRETEKGETYRKRHLKTYKPIIIWGHVWIQD